MNPDLFPTQNLSKRNERMRRLSFLFALIVAVSGLSHAETTNQVPVLQIQADQVAAHVSPMLYGLMTEEINYSYDGGLCAELIINRSFKEDSQNPVWWHLLQDEGASGTMSLDKTQPLNEALTTSLKLEAPRPPTINGWGSPMKGTGAYRSNRRPDTGARFTREPATGLPAR